MWQVDNRTPFAADRGWVRDRDGAEVWIVAVKCTFDINADGSTRIAAQQPCVLRLPEHHGDAGKSSIKYDGDLVLTKTTTDVILVGSAHAASGDPVQELVVEMTVGANSKRLRVNGDRVWNGDAITSAQPFVTMPLVYERAFGGVDQRSSSPERDWEWRNPVGTGYATRRAHVSGLRLPNVEYCDHSIRSWEDHPAPAGFGAICSHWQPRAAFAGSYDERWMRERQPLLPHDFDDRFFQCAPLDQQSPSFLTGGEPVHLVNLSSSAVLRFSLPRVSLQFDTLFFTGEERAHEAPRLHTVILEPDHPRVSLVWHTSLACHSKVQKLEKTIVTVCADPEGHLASANRRTGNRA
jgi:hypothetical protein